MVFITDICFAYILIVGEPVFIIKLKFIQKQNNEDNEKWKGNSDIKPFEA
jgi:hypothetical protein